MTEENDQMKALINKRIKTVYAKDMGLELRM